MKTLPKTIIRIDDGAEFVLDESTQRYSLKSAINDKNKGHLVMEYDYHTLMVVNAKYFKIPDGTEDLKAMQDVYYNFNFRFIGCGDDGEE